MPIESRVFLTYTDTTIGFVSQSAKNIDKIKQRPSDKSYITALPSLKALKLFTRVPTKYKNRVRRAKSTTYIYPNGKSYRVIKDTPHNNMLNRVKWLYTTSANLSGEEYNREFAIKVADVIVSYPTTSNNQKASSIFKINDMNIKKIR